MHRLILMIHNLRNITRWNSLWRFNCSNHWVIINFKTHMSPTFLKRWSPLCQIRPTRDFTVCGNSNFQLYTISVTKEFPLTIPFKCNENVGRWPNVMAARLDISGALCESSAILFLVARRKFWLTPAALAPCNNAANIGERKTWEAKWILHLAKFRQGARAPENV